VLVFGQIAPILVLFGVETIAFPEKIMICWPHRKAFCASMLRVRQGGFLMNWRNRLRYFLGYKKPQAQPPTPLQQFQRWQQSMNVNDYKIIHLPPSGCPVGWKLALGVFLERDGTRLDGCINPHPGSAQYSVDALLPGESVTFGWTISPVEPAQPDAQTG
jgi:hypothetical protein